MSAGEDAFLFSMKKRQLNKAGAVDVYGAVGEQVECDGRASTRRMPHTMIRYTLARFYCRGAPGEYPALKGILCDTGILSIEG